MIVWLLQIGETLPIGNNVKKLRTFFLAEKLAERGHSVIWWASTFDHFSKQFLFPSERDIDLGNGVLIKALKGCGYKKNVSFSRLRDHRIIANRFKKLAKQMPYPDFIVASFPAYDLANEAVIFAKKNRIPVLVDIRDQWPDLFIEQVPFFFKKLSKFLLFNEFRIAKKAIKNADGITSMMHEILNWGLSYANREKTWKDQVFYLGGIKLFKNQIKKCEKLDFLDRSNDKFIVTFIGTFASYHNPEILIEVAKKLGNREILFVLAGDGEYYNDLLLKSRDFTNVVLTGWLNESEIFYLLSKSNLGVCPSNNVAKFFPNKAFSYFSAGLPVISAFFGDLKELLEKENLGLQYRSNDVSDLTDCILKFFYDRSYYDEIKKNVEALFNERFEANAIYSNFADHIEKVKENFSNHG